MGSHVWHSVYVPVSPHLFPHHMLHSLCVVWWKVWCHCTAVWLCPSHLISVPTPCLECVHASVSEFMSTWLPMSAPLPMHSYMETWVPCVGSCVCHNHPNFCHTPWLECVHASVHEFMSTWLLLSAPLPMHSLMESRLPLYGSVFVSQSPHFCSNTLFRMCKCICTCIYVHMPPHVSLTPYGLLYGNLESPVCQCVCPSHPASGTIPWLECVHVSVHVFISTWLPISLQTPMHGYMEKWLCVCVLVTSFLFPHLVLEYVHASVHVLMSTWVPHSAPPPLVVTWKPGCPCVAVCVCPSHPASGNAPLLECVHASVCEFMSTWLPMSTPPPMYSFGGNLDAPMWHCVFVTVTLFLVTHFG